ncbi:membrane dipeptidase [Myxococcus sp. AB056]|uniref:membrane dipeptidase n=1 Tax=Myxococcus sp. AB056 TaxID=2562792 RepID=UPI001147A5D5|nr:membrane dipeptidase [Myxococcus sp. AB056]
MQRCIGAAPRRFLSLSLMSVMALSQGCQPTDEELPVEESATGEVAQPVSVPGFAEMHHHMFAEEAFGGGWFHGKHNGSLVSCDGGFPESDHARVRMDLGSMLNVCPNAGGINLSGVPVLSQMFGVGGAVASEIIGEVEGTEGDTGLHLGRMSVPTQWPRWDTIAHQQAWEGWLQQAHQGGMSLVTISLVSNEFLCRALPYQNIKRPCDEMVDVDVQLQMARDFDARTPWAEIALSPAHARQIIASGKLAMVLSIESSKLFGTKNWQSELNRVYSLGVRSIQPVHQLDNRFGGAAPHNAIFQVSQFLENCHVDTDCGLTGNGFTLGFDVDANCKNTKGLTSEGRALVAEMMNKGMLVDVAHMSERSVDDTFAIAQSRNYYPMYISHGHFREVMHPGLAANEKTTPASIIRYLRQTGGMFGLRTAHDETRDYTRTPVANNCQGSTRSLAQAYEFGRLGLKVNMGFGADLNGFIQQTRPRFGPHGACSAGFAAEAAFQAQQQLTAGPPPLGTDFDNYGLAHVGLLPDVVRDLKQLGVNTTGLEGSSETFIRMWERATGTRTGMADSATNIDTSGVAAYVPKETRAAQYPTSSTCTNDSDCASTQYCGWGLNAGKCQNKKPKGAICGSARECLSNNCRWTLTCG